ncbi:THO complex subunit 1-like isoform X2 [Watersipora subatra]|uniref:THO complex subunit 1-like isoform X2 n=1 Tax=Watersipora subatra TaxID=2589382 RepID=UPI00355BAAFC
MAAPRRRFEFLSLRNSIQSFMESTQPSDGISITKFVTLLSSTPGSDGEKMPCVDLAFRDRLKELMMRQCAISEVVPLLEFTLLAIAKESCPLGTIFSMLMDLADCSTIDQCEQLFTFVENKMAKWKSEPFFSKGKNHLLRMCNDILKKLSKSQNTIFCGRIQLFLARLFPLTEKSGLNLLSEFNLDNLTVFSSTSPQADTVELPPEKQAESMEVDSLGLSLARDQPVDYAFYTKFWSLQEFFREPMQCYTKLAWKKFSTYAETVLARFQILKLDDPRAKRQQQKLKAVRAVKDQHTFFAKYLTSDKLFNLQLSDSNFRRYVLVQFLILFQYLTSHVKFRSTAVMNEEQLKWVAKTKQTVMDLIKETPDGTQFALTVERVLNMESNWSNWKNEQCPSFVVRANPKETRTRIIVRKRSMVDDLNLTDPKVFNLGNAELNNLWNQHSDNDVIIRSESRQFVPALDEYFEDAIMAADPKNQIEDSYKDVHKPGWQWQALRLLSKKSRHLFEQTQTPARKIPDYLEDIMRKLAKEIRPSADQSNPPGGEEEAAIETAQMQEEEDIEEEPEEATSVNDIRKSSPARATPPVNVIEDLPEALLTRSLVSNDQLAAIADQIQNQWEKLASKFTALDEDDLSYFKEKDTPLQQASNMLTVWKEVVNKDATVEKIATALKEAGFSHVGVKVFGASVYS